MRKFLLLHLALLLSITIGFAQSAVTTVWVENRENPLGVGTAQPRFSWKLQNDRRNTVQSAYEINVKEGSNTAWSTGKVTSNQSVHVTYNGKALESGKRYTWQVRVWDNSGKPSSWSKPAFFTMALLNEADWKASWITPGFTEDANRPSPLFRKEFDTKRKVRSAIAYITSHGLYEAFVNGQRIGDAYLTPGWTSYNKRLQYQVYDLTGQLTSGRNSIGVQLGSGWYRGNIGFTGQHNVYGKDIALLFQLEIVYSDGTSERIVSDGSWKTSTGDIQYSEIYHGETIDRLHWQ